MMTMMMDADFSCALPACFPLALTCDNPNQNRCPIEPDIRAPTATATATATATTTEPPSAFVVVRTIAPPPQSEQPSPSPTPCTASALALLQEMTVKFRTNYFILVR